MEVQRPRKGPEQCQEGPKTSQDRPRTPQDGAKTAQACQGIGEDGAKMAQDGPRWRQEGPKMAPRWPKMAPSWPQDGAKMAPRWPQDDPKMAQDGPKMTSQGGLHVIMDLASLHDNVAGCQFPKSTRFSHCQPTSVDGASVGHQRFSRWPQDGPGGAPDNRVVASTTTCSTAPCQHWDQKSSEQLHMTLGIMESEAPTGLRSLACTDDGHI